MVSGSQQREVLLVRNGKNYPPVSILKDVAAVMVEHFAHDNMTALYQTHILRLVPAGSAGQHLINPGAGRIDQQSCGGDGFSPGGAVQCADIPDAVFPAGGSDFRPGSYLCSPVCRVLRVQGDQPGIIDPAI